MVAELVGLPAFPDCYNLGKLSSTAIAISLNVADTKKGGSSPALTHLGPVHPHTHHQEQTTVLPIKSTGSILQIVELCEGHSFHSHDPKVDCVTCHMWEGVVGIFALLFLSYGA